MFPWKALGETLFLVPPSFWWLLASWACSCIPPISVPPSYLLLLSLLYGHLLDLGSTQVTQLDLKVLNYTCKDPFPNEVTFKGPRDLDVQYLWGGPPFNLLALKPQGWLLGDPGLRWVTLAGHRLSLEFLMSEASRWA